MQRYRSHGVAVSFDRRILHSSSRRAVSPAWPSRVASTAGRGIARSVPALRCILWFSFALPPSALCPLPPPPACIPGRRSPFSTIACFISRLLAATLLFLHAFVRCSSFALLLFCPSALLFFLLPLLSCSRCPFAGCRPSSSGGALFKTTKPQKRQNHKNRTLQTRLHHNRSPVRQLHTKHHLTFFLLVSQHTLSAASF